jgi:hypothetical protein
LVHARYLAHPGDLLTLTAVPGPSRRSES